MITVFNTEREYSVHGQRIAAVQLGDGRVVFQDVDRGIDGVTVAKYHHSFTGPSLKAFVMEEYDNLRYDAGYEIGNYSVIRGLLRTLALRLAPAVQE